MDEDEPDEGRRMILRAACALPAAGGIIEVALKLLEAGSVERRAARYGVRALVDTGQREIPMEKAAQAMQGGEQHQR